MQEYRLVVVGPPVVGKSALTIRLTQAEFANEYDPTIEDSYRHYCVLDGQPVSLDILDTAGQEEYSSMRDMYMKTGEGFLLVFSLTDRASFDEIGSFYHQIVRVKGESVAFVPLVLVGNKCDLPDERQVSQQEGAALAQKFNCAYIETSAKTDENVSSAFHNVVKMVMAQSLYADLQNTVYPTESELREHRAQLEQAQSLPQQQQQNGDASPQQKKKKGKKDQADVALDNGHQAAGPAAGAAKATKPKNSESTGGCCVIV